MTVNLEASHAPAFRLVMAALQMYGRWLDVRTLRLTLYSGRKGRGTLETGLACLPCGHPGVPVCKRTTCQAARCYTTVLCRMHFERELCIELRVLADAILHIGTASVAAFPVRMKH